MAPRKPKQPARKAAAKKRASKTSKPSFNPDTHVLGEDGKVYEKKIVSGTGVGVGVNQTHKSTAHLELEKKMADAILQAHNDGITHPDEIRARILQAREDHLDGK